MGGRREKKNGNKMAFDFPFCRLDFRVKVLNKKKCLSLCGNFVANISFPLSVFGVMGHVLARMLSKRATQRFAVFAFNVCDFFGCDFFLSFCVEQHVISHAELLFFSLSLSLARNRGIFNHSTINEKILDSLCHSLGVRRILFAS